MENNFRNIPRVPKEYNRDEVTEQLNEDKNLSLVYRREQFKKMVKESSKEVKKNERDYSLLTKKPILKQRLVHLYTCGYYTNAQIAKMLCVSPATVRSWLKDEEVRDMINTYQTEENDIVGSALKSLREKAVNKLSELLDDDNSAVQLSAVKDILDRTGHKPIEKRETKTTITYEERLGSLIDNCDIQTVPYKIINDDDTEIKEERTD